MADEVVGVEESTFYGSSRSELTTYEMTVYGHEIDHRVYGKTKEEALAAAKAEFAQMMGTVFKVGSQLRSMEYDEEEY